MKAVIDLGTNTFHLLIAEVTGNKIQVIYKQQIPVKLGRGGVHKNVLAEDAIQRAFNALQTFHDVLKQYELQILQVFGTAAIRDAENGTEFIQKVYQKFGFRIQAISGHQEAEFIFRGVQAALPVISEPYLIMDIGGGSVEFIIVQNRQSVWKQSFRTGASRLIQSFTISDPMKEDEGRDLEAYFDQTYLPLTEAVAIYKPEVLAGSAGSFETLMDVLQMDMKADVIPLTENAYELPIIPAKKCIEMLVHSTRAKREQLKGLVAFRMEMIASAALMTGWVLKKFEMNRIITSLYSLKEGALLDA